MPYQSEINGHWMGEDGTDYGDNQQAAFQNHAASQSSGSGAGVSLPSASASSSPFDATSEVNKIFAGSGIAPGDSDIANLAGKAPEDRAGYLSALTAQRDLRARPTNDRVTDSQGAGGNTLYGSGTGNALNIPGGSFTPRPNDPRIATGQTGQPYPYAGNTFSDPWTSQLEGLITNQLNALTNPQPNSAQSQLMSFLQQRFGQLASSPGYTPEERALLNTQAFEPIEAQRQAAQKRVLERASLRGILPSSGLVQDEYATNDRSADQLRTVANRDLAINEINRRQSDLGTALQLGQAATAQDQNTRAQALSLATLLYQLPIQAQNQALAVINGTGSPQSLLPYVIQLAQSGAQNNADAARQVGLLAGLF